MTERKCAAERITQQNVLLNSVLESLAHPFYVIDANTYEILMANSATGATGPGMTTCYALTHSRERPCDSDEHVCPVRDVKRSGQSIITEHIHSNGEGEGTSIEIHAHPIMDDRGEVIRII